MKATVSMKPLPNVRAALCALCTSLAGVCFAQSPAMPPSFESESRLAAQLEQAPHEQLKAIYADCVNEAEQHLLGFGEAAACSMTYEALKRRVFGGDFAALIAWSRTLPVQQLGQPDAPSELAASVP